MDELDAMGLGPEEQDMIRTLTKGLAEVIEDAQIDDAVVVYEFLIENLTAGAATVFRKHVIERRRRTYMRDYMRSRRKELLQAKAQP